ncbi:PREDICTED: phytosulfokine receptor 1-like [Camelina sativa]|uniref:Phytosulfokine receptor 1-like n=1 Tax=Camelina sativa TaxID=90675 RepID=A0ABM1Q6Y6_CAMSA|nr:PREDICTED: phytosulfokine receptor 1-like [Camelina sativa]
MSRSVRSLLYCIIFASSFFLMTNALTCRQDQIQALMQFKNEFESDGCNSSDYLDGVQCDNATGAVTKLQLPRGCFTGTLKPNSSLFGPIPSDLLPSLPFLSYLDLKKNRLTGSIDVPNASSSSRLVHLSLGYNQFEGQILEPILKLTNLNYLELSSLNISYPIDLRVFSPLKSLLVLDLRENRLLPASLSSESDIPLSLKSLFLVRCDIIEFPNILKTLQNMELIDISNNLIKGKIPEWLWKLPRLNLVNLVNNSFTGFEGSSEVLVNSSLRIMDFAYNSMTGEFPIPPLNSVYLSAWNNSFTGNIPLSICNRSSLIVLDLSYNNFTGQIPQCLSNLKIVNLRKNSLEGSIPDEFFSNASIQTLDVGYKLSGNIPRGLGSLSFLAYISVAHNQLKGEIPEGPQFSGQAESSFEGNAGLCGLPLQGSFFSPPAQQPKEEDKEEEEDEVLNWKAVVIGYWPGLLFGLVSAHVIASYKPKWFVKIVGPDKGKEVDPVRLFMNLDSKWDSFNNKDSVEQESNMKI